MALTPSQQAQEHISRAKHILVVTRQHPTVDTIAGATALGLFLKASGKNADVVVPNLGPSDIPNFLKGSDILRPSVGAMRTLQISLDVSKTPIDEFLYDVREGKLEISIVPKEHEWDTRDIAFKHGEDRYDLVIALDAPDMKSLGEIAERHRDFLFRTTIINVDADGSNEHWGQINLVNLNAVSLTEVLFEMISEWNPALINEPIATALLAGMIAKTRGFRTTNVTPKTLNDSSRLISMGAKRGEIVNELWRTRSIETLKLWGRALSRLHHESKTGIVWTMLSHKDFLESGAGSENLPDVIDELIATSPEANIIVLLYEDERAHDSVCVTIATKAPIHAGELARELGASGTRDRVTVCLKNITLIDAANRVVEILQKALRNEEKSER